MVLRYLQCYAVNIGRRHYYYMEMKKFNNPPHHIFVIPKLPGVLSIYWVLQTIKTFLIHSFHSSFSFENFPFSVIVFMKRKTNKQPKKSHQ